MLCSTNMISSYYRPPINSVSTAMMNRIPGKSLNIPKCLIIAASRDYCSVVAPVVPRDLAGRKEN